MAPGDMMRKSMNKCLARLQLAFVYMFRPESKMYDNFWGDVRFKHRLRHTIINHLLFADNAVVYLLLLQHLLDACSKFAVTYNIVLML